MHVIRINELGINVHMKLISVVTQTRPNYPLYNSCTMHLQQSLDSEVLLHFMFKTNSVFPTQSYTSV